MTNGILRKSIRKDTAMAISGRACDFLATSADYFEMDIHSPTDSSEDSVEVKISPISVRNKRKCAEPRKVPDSALTAPLKKRMCLKATVEKETHPFRPWSPKSLPLPCAPFVPSSEPYFRPPSPIKVEEMTAEDQPIALVKKREEVVQEDDVKPLLPRVPVHPLASTISQAEAERIIRDSAENFPGLGQQQPKREQRNYKNMTRERRIEANARERTRVHTISAAFDTLRKSIPSYSHNQKLSKLSVLRIACSYIMTLSSIMNSDEPATASCVDLVTKTIQREGKLRKKKDDND